MIKDLKRSIVNMGMIGLLSLGAASSVFAGDPPAPTPDQLPQFLLNLGSYIGYNLNINGPSNPVSTMVNDKLIAPAQQAAIELYLGTILVTPIIPPTPKSQLASYLNEYVNAIFKSSESNASSNAVPPSLSFYLSSLIDQQPYQSNPINQTILNSLTTPDYSYCSLIQSSNDPAAAASLASKCLDATGLFQNQIGSNVIGGFPEPIEAFYVPKTSIPSLMNQLNGNTLLAPLVYSKASNTASAGSAGSSGTVQTQGSGLQATTQEQEALNFIRYVTGSVAPTPKTQEATYNALWNVAMMKSPTTTSAQAAAARSTLSTYLAGLRVFAAQTSVGVGNLYSIFSKRMSQTVSSGTGDTTTSQALNEYTMATRRLYDPTLQTTQWVDQINNASSATVQKEIAVLLSEINYQLYLTRQQQERLLLTNTVLLFQLGHLVEPTPLQAPSQ